jgi:predicted component of type VI protein secretion system
MKQQAQDLRYEVHRILTNIENQDIEEEKGYQDWTETEDGAPKIGVKDLNGKRYSRISESS